MRITCDRVRQIRRARRPESMLARPASRNRRFIPPLGRRPLRWDLHHTGRRRHGVAWVNEPRKPAKRRPFHGHGTGWIFAVSPRRCRAVSGVESGWSACCRYRCRPACRRGIRLRLCPAGRALGDGDDRQEREYLPRLASPQGSRVPFRHAQGLHAQVEHSRNASQFFPRRAPVLQGAATGDGFQRQAVRGSPNDAIPDRAADQCTRRRRGPATDE